jgi:Rieske Fe-S protein
MTAGTTRTGTTETTESTEPAETEFDEAAAAFVRRRDEANLEPTSDDSHFVSRRKVFAVGSAGALALGLAACGSGDDDSAAAAAGSADSSAAAGDSASGSATLVELAKVPVGGALGIKVGDKHYIVSQPTEGKAACFSAICPHQGCTVAASGTKDLACPCHGSTFNPTTGALIKGPATKGLPEVAVEITDGNVVTSA